MNADQAKQAAAEAAIALVSDGMVVGLGTGSTAKFAIGALGRRLRDGLRFIGIPTSEANAAQVRELGIPLASLSEHSSISLAIDGADENEVRTLVEVVPFGWQSTAARPTQLGCKATLRESLATDGGHFILEYSFGEIANPEVLARRIDSVVGVVEHDLFLGMAS